MELHKTLRTGEGAPAPREEGQQNVRTRGPLRGFEMHRGKIDETSSIAASPRLGTLSELQEAVQKTHAPRKLAFQALLARQPVQGRDLAALRATSALLKHADSEGNLYLSSTPVNVASEARSIDHDIRLLDAVLAGETLARARSRIIDATGLGNEVNALEGYLPERFALSLADRDGTVVPYAGQYRRTVESIVSSLGLAALNERSDTAYILSAGPLDDMMKLTLGPTMRLAGSKGREFMVANGDVVRNELPAASRLLDAVARDVERAVAVDSEIAGLLNVGSGFQKKHGELTVAYQDINGSLSPETSQRIVSLVRDSVGRHDHANALEVHQTHYDIEVVLRGGSGAFNKADGVHTIHQHQPLIVPGVYAPLLVLGDTASDLALIDAARELGQGRDVRVVFVTEDPALRQRVRERVSHAKFASHPDALVLALMKGIEW